MLRPIGDIQMSVTIALDAKFGATNARWSVFVTFYSPGLLRVRICQIRKMVNLLCMSSSHALSSGEAFVS
jgi:hypothetical protein